MGHQQTQQPMRNPSITIRLGARIPDNRGRADTANATSKEQIKHFAVPRQSVLSSPPPLHSRQSRSAQRPSRGQSAVGSRSVCGRGVASAPLWRRGGSVQLGERDQRTVSEGEIPNGALRGMVACHHVLA